MNEPTLPPLPGHPEPMVMRWSELEVESIRRFGVSCYTAGAAAAQPEVERLTELFDSAKVVGIRQERRIIDLEAELTAIKAGDAGMPRYEGIGRICSGSGCLCVMKYNDAGEWVKHADALAAIAAAQAREVPAGWKLVPVEPTEAMLRAAVINTHGPAVYKVTTETGLQVLEEDEADAYRAMLSAVPEQPTAPQPTQAQRDALQAMADHAQELGLGYDPVADEQPTEQPTAPQADREGGV